MLIYSFLNLVVKERLAAKREGNTGDVVNYTGGCRLERGTVINRLIAWANWKLGSGVALGYPSSSSFTHLVVDDSRRLRSYDDDDAYHKQTDEAIKMLSVDRQSLLRLEYLSTIKTGKSKSSAIGITREYYYKLLGDTYNALGEMLDRRKIC